ncbi:hypothetical protein ACRALDRAFT_208677 [Sodiomyces alcalophilus JCM 7366]|uniref:uncharacterized protein n=1 Tax=Sodiomyces alcalophilus JCM 7366 TaxID=591952 RepID=UPI0039B5AD9A
MDAPRRSAGQHDSEDSRDGKAKRTTDTPPEYNDTRKYYPGFNRDLQQSDSSNLFSSPPSTPSPLQSTDNMLSPCLSAWSRLGIETQHHHHASPTPSIDVQMPDGREEWQRSAFTSPGANRTDWHEINRSLHPCLTSLPVTTAQDSTARNGVPTYNPTYNVPTYTIHSHCSTRLTPPTQGADAHKVGGIRGGVRSSQS